MSVIDIRQDPMVDIANARALGNIFSAIGRAESLRKEKQDTDFFMSQVMANRGQPGGFDKAVQATRDRQGQPAQYDTGLKGIWQGLGNVMSFGQRKDVTEDLTKAILANQMTQEAKLMDPGYQADLAATQANTEGVNLRNDITKKTMAATVDTANANAATAQVRAKAAPEEAELGLASQAMENQIKAYQLENYPADYQRKVLKESQDIKAQRENMGYAAADAERAAEIHALMRKNEADQESKRIEIDEYEAQKRVLEIRGKKLDNKYRKAQTEYTERRGKEPTKDDYMALNEVILGGIDASNIGLAQQLAKRTGGRFVKLPDTVSPEGKSIPGGYGYEADISANPNPQPGVGQSAGASPAVTIASQEDFNKLPSGTEFIGPDGKKRRKP